MNEERNAQIIKMWNEGSTGSFIAKSLGIPETLVWSLIFRRRSSGEITRPKASRSRNHERNMKIVKLWNGGYSIGQVARATDVTKNVVIGVVVKYRALGSITRPMVESRGERGKLGIIARYGIRRHRQTARS